MINLINKKLHLTSLIMVMLIINMSNAAAEKITTKPLLISPLKAITLYDLNSIDRQGNINITLNGLKAGSLKVGSTYQFDLPDGTTLTSKLKKIKPSVIKPSFQKSGHYVLPFMSQKGSLNIYTDAEKITKLVLHDVDNDRVYKSKVDEEKAVLVIQDINEFICHDYKKVDEKTIGISLNKRIPVGSGVPSLANLQNLNSNPGATNTIYLNYWGGVLTDTAWNDSFNNGNPIEYTPFSSDSDTDNFSEEDMYRMWLGWMEMAEDYAPFDVNITTNQAVYNSTPIINRSQIIGTPNNFLPASGGIAFIGIFDRDTDYFKTGWTFNSSEAIGETHSHESGHQMGLEHDGIAGFELYFGNAIWAPIMGGRSFNGKTYVQWSNGEYDNPTNTEDDLQIISNELQARPDDAPDTNAAALAASISLPYLAKKQITPRGVTTEVDRDVFAFTLTSDTLINIKVESLLGHENEDRAGNLTFQVTLEDDSGSIIGSIDPTTLSPITPVTNGFDYTNTLSAGTYYLSISPLSPDSDWVTGFGNYGIGGEYYVYVAASSQYTYSTDYSFYDYQAQYNNLGRPANVFWGQHPIIWKSLRRAPGTLPTEYAGYILDPYFNSSNGYEPLPQGKEVLLYDESTLDAYEEGGAFTRNGVAGDPAGFWFETVINDGLELLVHAASSIHAWKSPIYFNTDAPANMFLDSGELVVRTPSIGIIDDVVILSEDGSPDQLCNWSTDDNDGDVCPEFTIDSVGISYYVPLDINDCDESYCPSEYLRGERLSGAEFIANYQNSTSNGAKVVVVDPPSDVSLNRAKLFFEKNLSYIKSAKVKTKTGHILDYKEVQKFILEK